MNFSDYKLEAVATLCHNVNKAYCDSIGDHSQVDWKEAPGWQKDSARKGVQAHIDSKLTMTPEGSHESWMKEKENDGWIYGEIKDVTAKTHPCMVPYNELPESQRTKDYLFRAIVHTAYAAVDVSELVDLGELK